MKLQSAAIQIRNFERADIPFALQQTGREGWDTTAGFLETLLAHDPGGSFLATIEGRPAGMVTTTCYAKSGWIGNVIVPPEFRNHSIGSTLTNFAATYLGARGVRTIRLEADPMGLNIYRRLGFVEEFDSPRFRLDEGTFPCPSNVRPLKDPAEASELDLRIFGDDRSRMLRLLFNQALAAFKIARRGQIRGYIFVQPSSAGCRLGPWIAENVETARDLMCGALNKVAKRPVIVALPGFNSKGIELLSVNGFVRTPSSLRMIRGALIAFGKPSGVYGLAGGAVG